MVDLLTRSLVDSLLQCVFSQLPSSALTWALMPLFTIHGSRQSTETKSHGQAAIRKRFSSPGPQEGKWRLNSFQPTLQFFFFFLLLLLNTTTVMLLYCQLRLVAQLPPQKPNENTPFTPEAHADQSPNSRGNHSAHTPFLPDFRPLAATVITKHSHAKRQSTLYLQGCTAGWQWCTKWPKTGNQGERNSVQRDFILQHGFFKSLQSMQCLN